MTDDKIIELARKYESDYDSDYGYTLDDLIAFAQSVIEEDRKQLLKNIMPHLAELVAIAVKSKRTVVVSEKEQDGILSELLKVLL